MSFHHLISFVPSSGETFRSVQKVKTNKSDHDQEKLGKDAKAFYEDLLSESSHESLQISSLKSENLISSSSGKLRSIEGSRPSRKRKTSTVASKVESPVASKSSSSSIDGHSNISDIGFFDSQTFDRNRRQHFKLLQSAQLGHVEEVRDLLKSGLNVNFQDFYGWTPLMCASNEGHASVVKVILEAGGQRSLKNSSGDNAFFLARNAGHSKLAELIKRFENVHGKEDSSCAPSSSSLKKEFFYCETCKREFDVKEQKSHYSSTAHLFDIGKRKIGPTFLIPETNRGFQMLLRSGWTGDSGLGPDGKGPKYPVKTVLKQDRRGLGDDQECKKKARVTHFNPNDEKAIQAKNMAKREMSVRTLAKKAQKRKEKREIRWEKNLRYELS